MPFNTPSLEDIIKQGEQDIENGLQDGQPRLPFSVERAINFAMSAMAKDLYDYQSYLSRQIVPNTQSDDTTIIERANRRGIIRKTAQRSAGKVKFLGVDGTVVTIGVQMKRGDGVVYTTTSNATVVNGLVVVDVKSQEPGQISNAVSGVSVKLLTPIADLKSDGVFTDAAIGGTDIETISDLLDRYLFQLRYPPQGGAAFDYKRWALENAGVTRAWVYPTWRGSGTVGVAFVRDYDPNIFPDALQNKTVEAYIEKHVDPATGVTVGKPINARIFMISLKPKHVQLTIGKVTEQSKRDAIGQELQQLSIKHIIPGYTLLNKQIDAAIIKAGVFDYTLNVAADTHSLADELIYFGAITWL